MRNVIREPEKRLWSQKGKIHTPREVIQGMLLRGEAGAQSTCRLYGSLHPNPGRDEGLGLRNLKEAPTEGSRVATADSLAALLTGRRPEFSCPFGSHPIMVFFCLFPKCVPLFCPLLFLFLLWQVLEIDLFIGQDLFRNI